MMKYTRRGFHFPFTESFKKFRDREVGGVMVNGLHGSLGRPLSSIRRHLAASVPVELGGESAFIRTTL
jgi:hypothetical protein